MIICSRRRGFDLDSSHEMLPTHRLFVLALLFVGSITSVPLTAQTLVAVGPEFQVTSEATYSRFTPDVAGGLSGDVIAVSVGGAGDSSSLVYGQRFDINDGFAEGPFQVNAQPSRYLFDPAVGIDSNGDFLVVWHAFFEPKVQGQYFDAEGKTTGSEFQVSQATSGYQRSPVIAAGAQGGFLVAWHNWPIVENFPFSKSGREFPSIRVRWVHPESSSSDEQPINESEVYEIDSGLDVARGPTGEFVAVWSNLGADIKGRRISATGQPIGSEFQISQNHLSSYPKLAVSSEGEYLVVWEASVPGGEDIFGRRLSAMGVPIGDEFRINDVTVRRQRFPAVSAGLDGHFLVTWQSEISRDNDVEDESIQLRAVDALGVPLTPEVQVNQFTLGGQVSPSITTASDGTFVVTWQGRSPDGTRSSIWGRRFALPARCPEGSNTLCLNQDRFSVKVNWRDFAGREGAATTVQLDSQDSGMLWFFSEDNWEMLVKVLDGCDFNGNFWVFAAATTDVEYTMTVTDTFTGAESHYSNPLGMASPAITDTEAFISCWENRSTAAKASPSWLTEPATRHPSLMPAHALDGPKRSETMSPALVKGAASCDADDSSLCLNQERFKVEVEWSTAAGDGSGRVDPLRSSDAGLFWFFSPNNLELLVKVLDGCNLNDRFWVFSAATTDVEHVLRVTDTVTGAVRTYSNPAGVPAPAITDTDAFDCP